jgi:hypothetical protein
MQSCICRNANGALIRAACFSPIHVELDPDVLIRTTCEFGCGLFPAAGAACEPIPAMGTCTSILFFAQ